MRRVVFECSTGGVRDVRKLVEFCKMLGESGSTVGFKSGHRTFHAFDGDGPSKVMSYGVRKSGRKAHVMVACSEQGADDFARLIAEMRNTRGIEADDGAWFRSPDGLTAPRIIDGARMLRIIESALSGAPLHEARYTESPRSFRVGSHGVVDMSAPTPAELRALIKANRGGRLRLHIELKMAKQAAAAFNAIADTVGNNSADVTEVMMTIENEEQNDAVERAADRVDRFAAITLWDRSTYDEYR